MPSTCSTKSYLCKLLKLRRSCQSYTITKLTALKIEHLTMGRVPGMTLDRRQMAIGMLNAGVTAREVARQFNVNESTISRLKTRYQLTGNVKDMPRSGRPRKTTLAEDRYIVVTSRRNRFMCSRRLAESVRNATGTRVCDRTVRNRLRAARLHGRRPHVGIPLTRRHRQDQVTWARLHHR